MNEELAAPVAEAENTATEPTQAEIVTPQPEPKTESQTPEKDERDKSIARLERRINRKHADAAAANERVRMLEERLSQFERDQPQERQKVEVDPDDVQRVIQSRAEQLSEQSQLRTRIEKLISQGQEKFPNFDRLTAAMTDELPIVDQRGNRTPAMEAILDCDDPAAVIAHLGENPDLAASLNGLSISRVARRLEQIERDIKQPPKPSAAPKPHEPEKSGSSSSMPNPERDLRGWIEARNKQEAAKRNR